MNMTLLNTMIPLELKAKPNWVLHHKKVPMMASQVGPAASNDRRTWTSYNEAMYFCDERHADGLGFMFEAPFIGIDLDDCIEDGKINSFASGIINATSSYTEYSPSKTGIHIICKGALPAPIKTSTLEVYQTGRYFTMTGDRISKHSLLRQIDDFSFLYPNGYKQSPKLNERINSIQEGNRNNTLTGIAGSLRAKGYSSEEIFELLKPKAKEINFSEMELWTICKSMGRYTPNISTISNHGESVESFLADREEVKWICEPFIAEQAIGFIAGLPESRKSWILIDLAVEAARGGGLWLNKFPVKGAKVLLIDQERSKSEVQRRLQAVLGAKGLAASEMRTNLFVRSGTSTRIDLQHSYDALRKELSDLRPTIVLIDSFATFHTKNESNRAEIQQVMERIKDLRNEFKCAIIMIHHETKQAYQNKKDGAESSYLDMAGNVAIPAAAEFCMNVVKQDAESSFCHHTKSTQGSKQASFLVKVTDVDGPSKIKVEAF